MSEIIKPNEMLKDMPYQITLNDGTHFVGYVIGNNRLVKTFRTGLNTKLMFLTNEIKQCVKLSPRDIETRKNGKYYIL